MRKSRNLRFVNRVFTTSEQRQIFNSADPDTMIWAIWAGKETAYKIVSKCCTDASSTPRLYEVNLYCKDKPGNSYKFSAREISISGSVDTPYGQIYIRIFLACDYVHCVGATAPLETTDAVVWHVDRISPDSEVSPEYESMFVRDTLKKHLSAYVDGSPEDMEIRREKGTNGLNPPFVYLNGRRDEIDISLSHDGAFTAYAFTISDSSPAV